MSDFGFYEKKLNLQNWYLAGQFLQNGLKEID